MKKSLFVLLIFLFTLPVFAKNTILIVGDSLSAGYGIEVNQGWVNLLRERLEKEGKDYTVVNSSISGDTTSNGLSRLPTALEQYQPTITIIELGANDGLRGLQIETIKTNLRKMIELAKQAGSEVLLVGIRLPPNYGPLYTEQFQALFTAIAKENSVSVVPLLLQGVDEKRELIQADGLHPKAAAQEILLDNVWVELQPLIK